MTSSTFIIGPGRRPGEQRANRFVVNRVAFLLELLDGDDMLVNDRRLSHRLHRTLDLVGGAKQDARQLFRRRPNLRDVQHLEPS